MKRGMLVLILLSLILILSVAPVSAGFFSDFWNRITGGSTAPSNGDEVQPIVGGCTDACGSYSNGQRICYTNTDGYSGYKTCGNYDSDSCLEFSNQTVCPSGQTCSNGECVANCGNGAIEGTEQCDGSNLNGQTCVSRGFSGGILGCTSYCAFNTTNCVSTNQTTNITCYSNVNCPQATNYYCNENGLRCQNSTSYQCENPGITSSYCLASGGGASCGSCVATQGSNSTCYNGACVPTNQTTGNSTCTDSDGGNEIYLKGTVTGKEIGTSKIISKTDYCTNQNNVVEYFCNDIYPNYEPGYVNNVIKSCPNSCVDGACVSLNYTGTCSTLVNQIANPSNFEEDSIKYYLSWANSYNYSWWYNKTEYAITEYAASWWLNYEDSGKNSYGMIQKSMIVFDDKNFDALNILKYYIDGGICQVHGYNDNLVYICNWNAYNKGVDIDQSTWKNREILWAHNNVLVRFSVGFGQKISEEELSRITERETKKFIDSLKDNSGKYLGWEDFSLDWPFRNHMFKSLEMCSSDVPQNTCSPYWQCITEPAICPEYGRQTQTCRDLGCDSPDIVSEVSCNPGICSGCLVPKWFESRSLGNNKCIPYGFRLKHQVGWIFGEETGNELVKLSVGETKDEDEINFSITPEGAVSLSVEGWGNQYTFKQGDKVEVNVTGWDKDIISLSFVATEVVYDDVNYENSYVVFNFTVVSLGKIADTISAYCDIDGYIKPQETKLKDDSPAECENNYECTSNQCSNGFCIDLSEQIKSEVGFFKSLGCRILNIISFSAVDYNECLAGNTG